MNPETESVTQKPARLQSLREWMERNSYTQGELAKALHISQGHLSAIFVGKRRMTLEPALRAAVVTELPIEKLCNDPDALQILKLYVIRNRRAA